jgi:hypothetical protein
MIIHFYISNSNHHWQMMRPVIKQLQLAGDVYPVLVSLCEFRRMETPEAELKQMGIVFLKLLSLKTKSTATSTGAKHIGGNQAWLRNMLRNLVWALRLRKRVADANNQRPDLVVIPNDTAYPFNKICSWLRARSIPFVLFQEGIRFPLPNEIGGVKYGTNGASKILAWGESSAQYFRNLGIPASSITVGGNPRFDEIVRLNKSERALLRSSLNIDRHAVLYVSNPVDDQGFCSLQQKMELFEKFLIGMEPLCLQEHITLLVRLHPRESLEAFKAVGKNFKMSIRWAQQGSLFQYLQIVDFTVVLASTVGLESMLMSTPVAVLKLPEHGFVFDYVSSGAALGLNVSEAFASIFWQAITEHHAQYVLRASEYIARHLGQQGNSAAFIADHLSNFRHAHSSA